MINTSCLNYTRADRVTISTWTICDAIFAGYDQCTKYDGIKKNVLRRTSHDMLTDGLLISALVA